jgi:hypothetical protein
MILKTSEKQEKILFSADFDIIISEKCLFLSISAGYIAIISGN